MSGTIIRQANEGDLDGIMAITQEVVKGMNDAGNFQWTESYPVRQHFLRDIAQGWLYVAVLSDEEIVGFGALTTDQSPEYGDHLDISIPAIVPHRLAVSPRARGKGVASLLLQKAEQLALESGYDRIRIDTNKVNIVMQKVVTRNLFTFAGEIGLAGRPGLTFVCYEKILSP